MNAGLTWFGTSWDAPLNVECPHQDTPIGELCTWCDEPIESYASGVVMLHIRREHGAQREPRHLECFIRSSAGSIGHQLGLCICDGGPGTMDDPVGYSLREAALGATYLACSDPRDWVLSTMLRDEEE